MTAYLRSIAAAAGVGVLLFGVACTGERGKVWTPESADLLFMSNRDGDAEIYLIAAGSSEWTNPAKQEQEAASSAAAACVNAVPL